MPAKDMSHSSFVLEFTNDSSFFKLIVLALAGLVVYPVLLSVQRRISDRGKLPVITGPRGWPLIGHLPTLLSHVKTGSQHLLFQQWARQYGAVYRVNLGPVTQYMINSDKAVKAIFEGKNASISANRPRWIVSNEHICHGWNVLMIDGDTTRWKNQRKVAAGNVGSVVKADAGVPVLEYESLKFLLEVSQEQKLQQSNKELWQSVMRYTYSAFTTQMFGLDVPNSTDTAIHYIHETGTAQIIGTLPGSYLVDIFPVLERLPLALKPWARAGKQRFQRDVAWCTERMNRVAGLAEDEQSDAVVESLMHKIISSKDNLGFPTKEEGAYYCLMLTIGAADTSQISTWAFLEAMMRYPNVQRKAQAAVDEIVGSDKVPMWSDYNRLPYIRCLVKETWRWRPPVGLGHPHMTTADIEYDGHRIPCGSRIHLNGWALQHDPARHADPDEFVPERYEADETTAMQSINSADVTKRDHFAFGAGRRVCPGYNVAERSMALAAMRILWAFDVEVAKDAKLPLNSLDWRGTFPGLPGPDMPVVMKPRAGRLQVMEKAMEMEDSDRGVTHSM